MATVTRIAAVSCLSTMPLLYGLKHAGNLRAELVIASPEEILRLFTDKEVDIALMPAALVASAPEAKPVTGYCVGGDERSIDSLILIDEPLVDEWRALGADEPALFAVWVAREEISQELVEQIETAITFGLEHTYEAIMASEFATDAVQTYETLSHFDYIFDAEKRRALEKFWDSGLKIAPRANPG